MNRPRDHEGAMASTTEPLRPLRERAARSGVPSGTCQDAARQPGARMRAEQPLILRGRNSLIPTPLRCESALAFVTGIAAASIGSATASYVLRLANSWLKPHSLWQVVA